MDLTKQEQMVLERFHEKALIAGGPRPGYMLRERAIAVRYPGEDLGATLASLVEKDLLKTNEAGGLYYLTAAGNDLLSSWGA